MNSSSNESTPLCFSINSPPFKYNHTVTSAYFSSVFCTLGLSSNLVAFVVLLKSFQRISSRSRSSFLVFLCGLVATDFTGLLVTGVIVVSFHVTHFNWRSVDPHCHLCNFMGMSMVFYGLCPLLLGAAMAVERFIGINCPLARLASVPKRRAVLVVLSMWTFAGCVALLPVAGVGSYHMQMPGSWCFLNISSVGSDLAFSLLFSLVGLLSIGTSFVLNTVSVVTLIKVCCRQDEDGRKRRRDYEVEMMVQLILIMVIASACWCPLLVFIAQTVLSGERLQIRSLLLWLRFATWNQILDPWVYILCRRAILRRLYPSLGSTRGSSMSLLSSTIRRLTLSSVGSSLKRQEPSEEEAQTETTAMISSSTNRTPRSPSV